MSLPQTSTMKQPPTQSSIKSFFQPRQQPSYAPPPLSSKYAPAPSSTGTAAAAPPPTTKTPIPTASTSPPPPKTTTTTTTTTTSSPPRPTIATPPTSQPPASTPLHPNASIRPISDQDLQPFRRINSLLLPVAYPETFYAAALTGPFSRVLTWREQPITNFSQEIVVGGVVARIEPSPFPSATPTPTRLEHALYIQSLALLSPYRSHGLATAVVDHLVAAAANSSPDINLRHIYAHVWTDNEEGMRWYAARGFERYGEPLQGYYIKLRPDSAWIVRRSVGPLSIGSGSSSERATAPPMPGPTAAVANLPPMNGGSSGPPPSLSRTISGQSFQNRRAATEWNDLPDEMASAKLAPPLSNGGSGTSSRSSSKARKKKDRSYPAAAFQG
ncbi:acetyltransferase [Colletotrichum orchidophilum]|uniref:Acetyltransferase n=1 Tax=Colletotrichum orchidophilum TaxID=1209926 RepID=A0A1G4BD89_9PEZI|nr:acetyltransferase [Colletotrichum orchidophilum]OHE99399.1 acetyltransferase [Colletotrichum orchidophilum]